MLSVFNTVAYAQSGAPNAPSMFELFALPMAFLVIMYLLVLRPQQKRQKEQQQLISQLKNGDEVVTSGGIIGRVKSISEAFVTIESGSSQFKILKEHLSGRSEKAALSTAKKS